MEEPTTLDFQDICLKDKKGKVWVAMWGKMVSPYQVGNLLKITKCKVKLFNGQKKLSTTQSSTSEVCMPDIDLIKKQINPELSSCLFLMVSIYVTQYGPKSEYSC